MRRLLQILGAGLLAFMGVAVAQRWEVFASALRGQGEVRAPSISAEQQEYAVVTVRQLLNMMQHAYRSDGDARFFEHMPAAPEVVDELRRELDFLRQAGRRQEARLVHFEVQALEPRSPEEVEVRTVERWHTRTLALEDDVETAPAVEQQHAFRYLVVLEGSRWRVRAWDLSPDSPAGDTTAPAREP